MRPGLILRHELVLLRREPSWWFAVLLLLVAVTHAWANGSSFRERRIAEVGLELESAERHLAAERQSVADGEPGGFSGRAGSARTLALAPAGRLADFAIGQSDLYPYRAEISAFRRVDDLFRNYQLQSPLSLMVGRFDLSFVVVYLLPLLIIALSYNLLSSERERGTLRLTLTQPLSIQQLLMGKLAARVAAVLGPFALLAAAAFVASGDLSSERLVLFLLWLAISLSYGLLWIAVTAFVNVTGRRSETNAVILASAWLLLVVVVPGVLNVVVNSVAPTPSRLTYVSEMRSATAEASKRSADVLANYYEDHPELAAEEMQGGFLPAFFAQQRDIEDKLEPIVDEFESGLFRQQRLVRLTSLLSPAVVVHEAFNDIAGTGLARQRSYTQQARDFLGLWHETLRPKVFTAADMSVADYDGLPVFEFREDGLSELSGRALLALLALAVPAVLLLLAARRRVTSYPATT